MRTLRNRRLPHTDLGGFATCRAIGLTAVGAAAVAAVTVAPRPARAADTTWLGGAGNWTDASKWSNGVPTAGVNVFIDAGNPIASVVTIPNPPSQTLFAAALNLDAGDQLITNPGTFLVASNGGVINGLLSLHGEFNGDFASSPTLSGTGHVEIFSGAPFYALSGLVIGPGLVVHTSQSAELSIPSNQGTIVSDGQFETLQFDGGTAATNSGTISILNQSTFWVTSGTAPSIPFNNAGLMTASSGANLAFDNYWHNSGTIRSENATVILGGHFVTADLANFVRTGTNTILLSGALDNSNAAFTLLPGDVFKMDYSPITVFSPGPASIRGGTVVTSAAVSAFLSGVLDGVTLSTGSVEASAGSLELKNTFTLSPGYIFPVTGLTAASATVTLNNSTLALNGSASLQFTPVLLNNGTLSFSGTGSLQVTSPLSGNAFDGVGDVKLIGNPLLQGVNGTIVTQVAPGVLVHGTGTITASGTFRNNGTVSADVPGGTLTLDHGFSNFGTLEVKAGSHLVYGFNSSFDTNTIGFGRTIIDGVLSHVVPGAVITLTGSVSGGGTADASLSLANGNISPNNGADPIGALVFDRNLSLFRFTYHADLSATGPSDQLLVNGNLDLGATSDLVLTPGLPVGDSFVIATYGGVLSGAFASVTPGYAVDYSTPHEIIVTAAIPEPALAGWAATLAGGSLLVRRRRHRSKPASELP
jgi:hypothetical protein